MISPESLFSAFPEEFAMVEDIHKYTKTLVVKLDGVLPVNNISFEKSCYPNIDTSQLIIKFITNTLQHLSLPFTSAMMIKYKYTKHNYCKYNINKISHSQIILFYCWLVVPCYQAWLHVQLSQAWTLKNSGGMSPVSRISPTPPSHYYWFVLLMHTRKTH